MRIIRLLLGLQQINNNVNMTMLMVLLVSSKKRKLVCDIARRRTHRPEQVVPFVPSVITQDADLQQNRMSTKGGTTCLLCDTLKCRTQCIVPLVSCVISLNAQPNARTKSNPLSRVCCHKMQKPMPETNRFPCLVYDITRRNKSYPLSRA